MIDPKELADRSVAVWKEPDATRRRSAIRELWTEDGAHILQPPQEIRQPAAALGMTPRGGAVAGVGLEVLVLDDDGRIRVDYQFIEQ